MLPQLNQDGILVTKLLVNFKKNSGAHLICQEGWGVSSINNAKQSGLGSCVKRSGLSGLPLGYHGTNSKLKEPKLILLV